MCVCDERHSKAMQKNALHFSEWLRTIVKCSALSYLHHPAWLLFHSDSVNVPQDVCLYVCACMLMHFADLLKSQETGSCAVGLLVSTHQCLQSLSFTLVKVVSMCVCQWERAVC